MIFKDSLPIFQQIADRLSDEILAGEYAADERVPGVRDYAALVEVNAATVVKAYEVLSGHGIIASRRGMGYFVTPEARDLILRHRREVFYNETLPDLFRQMHDLGLTPDDIKAEWTAFQNKNHS